MPHKLRLTLSLGLILLTLSCVNQPQTTKGSAVKFLQALNQTNMESMLDAAGTPFYYRNQKWEMAKDGVGFVLGEIKDQTIVDAPALRSLFKELTQGVRVQRTEPAENPPAKEQFFKTELKGLPQPLEGMEYFVFLRGFGDVEHIALVGVDPVSRKVKVLYLN